MKPIIIYLFLIFIGLTILAWPEENNLMMVKFSETHGPSALDLLGIAIIFFGYIPMIIPVFTRFSLIQGSIGRQWSIILVGAVLFFSATIATGLVIESDLILWISVVLSTLLQAVLIYITQLKSKR